MLRSNVNTEKSDFNKVKDPEHIKDVWEIIEQNIPLYFGKMLKQGNEFGSLFSGSSFKVKSAAPDTRKKIADIFESGLDKYDKDALKYRNFFSDESMNEFEDEDDPKGFKSALSTKVPVILKGRNSKREMLREWQEKYARANAADVYAIFFNLIDFMNEFVDQIRAEEYGDIDHIKDLAKLFVLNEDDDYNVPGVIGMGIKSTVLYHLNPTYFLGANKNSLYGFYFLSTCENFKLPSRTNEFIMINDLKPESNRTHNTNMLIDQNYWYPYDLFILYGLRTYRVLKEICAKHHYLLDDKNRFVHVTSFMSQIWDIERDRITTMTGGDQDDAR